MSQRRAGHDVIPQLASFGQHPVVLAAHQVIGRMVHLARHHQQRQDVRLAVTDAHIACAGQFAGLLGDALQ